MVLNIRHCFCELRIALVEWIPKSHKRASSEKEMATVEMTKDQNTPVCWKPESRNTQEPTVTLHSRIFCTQDFVSIRTSGLTGERRLDVGAWVRAFTRFYSGSVSWFRSFIAQAINCLLHAENPAFGLFAGQMFPEETDGVGLVVTSNCIQTKLCKLKLPQKRPTTPFLSVFALYVSSKHFNTAANHILVTKAKY